MNKKVAFGLLILGVFGLITVLGPSLVPYSPEKVSGSPLSFPTWIHPMGTDHLGRDILSRILAGGGIFITTALVGSILGILLGTVVGLLAGYLGGNLDRVVNQIIDLLLSIPILLTSLLIVSVFGNDTIWLILGMGFVFIPRTAKIVRASASSEKTKEYIVAARAIGASHSRVVAKHIFPNIVHIVIVEATTKFAQGLLLVSALGFLGLGTPLDSPDWGRQIAEGRDYILVAPWMVLFPALAVTLLVIAINMIADGLQESNHRF